MYRVAINQSTHHFYLLPYTRYKLLYVKNTFFLMHHSSKESQLYIQSYC
jgi:hypothetical protein